MSKYPSRKKMCKLKIAMAILIILAAALTSGPTYADVEQLQLKPTDRILILAPHPDDETLACAGIIQRALFLHISVEVIFLTYGDSNQWSFLVYRKHPVLLPRAVEKMGLVRYGEARAAAAALGLSPHQLIFLGYPDFGTLNIWRSHWQDRPAYRGLFTQVRSVPYANAYRPGASYKGEEIVKDLAAVILTFKPTKIFVSHPADHHPDHQSLYLFTRVALWELESKMKPALYAYLVHYKHWPLPRGYHPQEKILPPEDFKQAARWQEYVLTAKELAHKLEAITKHSSQYRSSAHYLLSFIRRNELFGDFPVLSLKKQEKPLIMTTERRRGAKTAAEEVTDEQVPPFPRIEKHALKIEKNNLVFYVQLTNPIGEKVKLSLFIFGYRFDSPFANMPKIQIKLGKKSEKVYDQKRRILYHPVKIERQAKEIIITVPLSLLGNPDKVLTNVETSSADVYLEDVPLDWVAWRIIEIR